jgi:hypothetical protein
VGAEVTGTKTGVEVVGSEVEGALVIEEAVTGGAVMGAFVTADLAVGVLVGDLDVGKAVKGAVNGVPVIGELLGAMAGKSEGVAVGEKVAGKGLGLAVSVKATCYKGTCVRTSINFFYRLSWYGLIKQQMWLLCNYWGCCRGRVRHC